MKNVLVTGGTGFIGRHLVAALVVGGCRVRVLAREERPADCAADEWFAGDLRRPETLAGVAQGCDTVFHLAGYAHAASKAYPEEIEKHRLINLDGTQAVLDEALSAGVSRFVFVSSVKAGGQDPDRCMDETDAIVPTDPYGRIKHECEAKVFSACAENHVHAAVIRPALVYGVGVKGNIASMAHWIKRGLFPPVPDVNNKRSMVEVRDLVTAIIAAAECDSANGKFYIISDGERYSTRRIYEAIVRARRRTVPSWAVPVLVLRVLGWLGDRMEQLSGRMLPFNSTIAARLLESACYRSTRAEQDLGFQPKYRFEDVVEDIVVHEH